jgi:hypothetical protein
VATKTLSFAEKLETARAELEQVGRGMQEVRRDLKRLRQAGKATPHLEEIATRCERAYRNARAALRRREARSAS